MLSYSPLVISVVLPYTLSMIASRVGHVLMTHEGIMFQLHVCVKDNVIATQANCNHLNNSILSMLDRGLA